MRVPRSRFRVDILAHSHAILTGWGKALRGWGKASAWDKGKDLHG